MEACQDPRHRPLSPNKGQGIRGFEGERILAKPCNLGNNEDGLSLPPIRHVLPSTQSAQTRSVDRSPCVATVNGTAHGRGLLVFRSNQPIYAQVIDDEAKHPLCRLTLDKDLRASLEVSGLCPNASISRGGSLLAQRALAKKGNPARSSLDRGGPSCYTAGSRPLPMPAPIKRASCFLNRDPT